MGLTALAGCAGGTGGVLDAGGAIGSRTAVAGNSSGADSNAGSNSSGADSNASSNSSGASSNPDSNSGGNSSAGSSNSGGMPPAVIAPPPLVQVTTTKEPAKNYNVAGSGAGNAIGAPGPGTMGANAGMTAPGCCLTTPGTKFPLLQSAMQVTPAGIAADAATNSAGAVLTAVDAVAGKYELSIPSLGINYAFQTPSPMSQFPLWGSYLLTPSGGDVVRFLTDNSNYLQFGAWAVRSGSTGELKNFAFYVTGFPTASLPTTGTATYEYVATVGTVMIPNGDGYTSAELYGVGSTLTADFGAGVVSGSLKLRAWDGSVSSPWNDVSVSAAIAAGTPKFSGTTAATSAPAAPFALDGSATGHVDGSFYGPAAQAVGAIWSLSDGVRSAIGVLGGGPISAGSGSADAVADGP